MKARFDCDRNAHRHDASAVPVEVFGRSYSCEAVGVCELREDTNLAAALELCAWKTKKRTRCGENHDRNLVTSEKKH